MATRQLTSTQIATIGKRISDYEKKAAIYGHKAQKAKEQYKAAISQLVKYKVKASECRIQLRPDQSPVYKGDIQDWKEIEKVALKGKY